MLSSQLMHEEGYGCDHTENKLTQGSMVVTIPSVFCTSTSSIHFVVATINGCGSDHNFFHVQILHFLLNSLDFLPIFFVSTKYTKKEG